AVGGALHPAVRGGPRARPGTAHGAGSARPCGWLYPRAALRAALSADGGRTAVDGGGLRTQPAVGAGNLAVSGDSFRGQCSDGSARARTCRSGGSMIRWQWECDGVDWVEVEALFAATELGGRQGDKLRRAF